jgi:hypothetical protein
MVVADLPFDFPAHLPSDVLTGLINRV